MIQKQVELESSSKEEKPAKKAKPVDDTAESMSEFQEKVAIAQAQGDKWVETSPEIMKILRPRGLGVVHGIPVEHFCYHGVLVCEFGKSEEIEDKMNEPMTNKLHGKNEARIVSGG
jgi:hypothetical protein